MRRWLMAAAMLLLVIFVAWSGLRRVHPTQASPLQEPSAGPTRNAFVHQPNRGSAGAPSAGRTAPYQLSAQKILKYGRAEGEIGMISGKGQPPVGPESFAVGKDGGILVADVVNQRVVVYSSNGTYLRSIDLPGIALGDVTADAQGRVYVYDQVRHALHQYDAHGAPQSALSLNAADIDTRGYFHVANSSVYFADAAARDVLIATLQDGLLTAPDRASERTTDGIHGESGRIYSMSVVKGQALRVQVQDPAAQSTPRNLEVPLLGILSARYAGEDQAQRFYVQTERLAGTSVVLEVLAFSPSGEQLAATQMPENDYAIWTARLVDVGADGTIVQFLPQHEQATLNLFTN
jgi:sugar lactone lactonase YvrE